MTVSLSLLKSWIFGFVKLYHHLHPLLAALKVWSLFRQLAWLTRAASIGTQVHKAEFLPFLL